MKGFLANLVYCFFSFAFSLRYRLRKKNIEALHPKALNKAGGILFLPNHPSQLDPVLVTLALWRKFKPHPVIVEYMFYQSGVNQLIRLIGGFPMPNFDQTINSFKRNRGNQMLQNIIDALKAGENVLLYPSGRLKNSSLEIVGGASGVHKILEAAPEANIVLVRTTGLWGSRFSRAQTGKVPNLGKILQQSFKDILRSAIFFMPRRHVEMEFVPAGVQFPVHGSRLEINKYLEQWYNHFSYKGQKQYGEPLTLVPYSWWNRELPTVQAKGEQESVDLKEIPEDLQWKVKEEVARIAKKRASEIHGGLFLATDLGMDSLDVAELITFLEDQFDVKDVEAIQLTTVAKVIGVAAGMIELQIEEEVPVVRTPSQWMEGEGRPAVQMADGETLPEAFLKTCDRMGEHVACSDERGGIFTYQEMKLRILLLARLIEKLPGERVGILLPASVASYAAVLACHLVGKVPVMLNWTLGPKHLAAARKKAEFTHVISSWAFLDRLENVDLEPIEGDLLLLEELRDTLTWRQKVSAMLLKKKPSEAILRSFPRHRRDGNVPCVLLFTSGTEGDPKAVPLTHRNILENHRGALKIAPFTAEEVMLGSLPPFHSFGFSVTGLLPLLSGMRVTYSPNPTDAQRLVMAIEKWKVTLLCLAPTFLKNVFRASSQEQLRSLHFIISGAEKAPPSLFETVAQKCPQTELLQGYGITECSPILTLNRHDEPKVGVGKAIPGVELCVVDPETHEPCEMGKQGMVLAHGPNVFHGYHEEESQHAFAEVAGRSWYITGDLGTLDEEKNLSLTGRLKRFVKVGGEMINMTAIEQALGEAFSAEEKEGQGASFAVCALENEEGRPRLILFTTQDVSRDQVNKSLKSMGFSNISKIHAVCHLASIPLLGTGKVNYRELESSIRE